MSVAASHAAAQAADRCGPPTQNYIPGLPPPGAGSISVATDLRGLAPVKPAIVVNVLMPAGSQPLVAQGRFVFGLAADGPPVEVAGSEIWVLGPGPRAPLRPVDMPVIYTARSENFPTQYKLYLRIPPEVADQFIVTFPDLLSARHQVAMPALTFHRIPTGPEVEICSILPGLSPASRVVCPASCAVRRASCALPRRGGWSGEPCAHAH